jgi:hypothetical protein
MKKTIRTFSLLAALVAVPGLALAQPGGPGKAGDPDRQARHAAKIAAYDLDGDGKLDAAEREQMHEAKANERFDLLDTNRDGSISRAEFKAGAKMRGKHHRGMKRWKHKQGAPDQGAQRFERGRGKAGRMT